MMSTLRMQFYMIIGQGVPEIQGVTHTHTDLRIYYIDGLALFVQCDKTKLVIEILYPVVSKLSQV